MVGKDKKEVWSGITSFAPQLDQLQHKGDTITSEVPADPATVCDQYWSKVGNNIIDLAQRSSRHQVMYLLLCYFWL